MHHDRKIEIFSHRCLRLSKGLKWNSFGYEITFSCNLTIAHQIGKGGYVIEEGVETSKMLRRPLKETMNRTPNHIISPWRTNLMKFN